MAETQNILTALIAKMRLAATQWWGGIGCRISFFFSLALFLVAALIGMFFLHEGRAAIDAEVRGRALYVGRYFSALMSDDIIEGNALEIHKKLLPAFLAHDRQPTSSDLVYVIVYNRSGNVIAGRTFDSVITPKSAVNISGHANSGTFSGPGDSMDTSARELRGPRFQKDAQGIYDLTMPVIVGGDRIGFLRIGLSSQWRFERFSGFMNKALVVMLGILTLGLLFSQIIAAGIIRPLARLSAAADELSKQNWKTPVPVRGRDEISKLANAFNQMALTLKQREVSLSQGNRDLFILHTAGLDLMENLDRSTLIGKIGARVDDLVRADTTAVLVIDRAEKRLKYLGVTGGKSRTLTELAMPFEAGGVYNWFVSYGTPLLIADARTDFRLDSEAMAALGIRCIMAAPLWSSNALIGILTAINKKGGASFDKHDLRLFTVFSNLAAAALQNASLYADLKGKMYELGNAQEQLVHSTKMAAIGELAANVAHEINNPLTSVLGYTSHLIKTLDVPESSRRTLQMMEQETLRVRKIIRNLLDFSRPKAAQPRAGDIGLPLRETIALIQGAAEARAVRITESYPPAPVVVNMDHNEMKQVFINIVNNALQAMPQGGHLHVRLDDDRGDEAAVEIADTGVGIPMENLDKIFEPFFSTKHDGDGTGLGLSISYRIVKNHGGAIEVRNNPGGGTLFRIVLPQMRNAAIIEKK